MKSAIRNTIRELRAARSMTQQELADLIFVTRQTVIAIEGDKYSPSLEVAFRIAHVFGTPLEQVFQYEPPVGGGSRACPSEDGKENAKAR
jgi:putative transcriptional regulator